MWMIELIAIVLLGATARAMAEAGVRLAWARWVIHGAVLGVGSLSLGLGVLAFLTGEPRLAARASGAAIGLLLAWWPPYRRLWARWIAINPTSLLDALGLAAIQGTIGLFVGALLQPGTIPSLEVSKEQLLGQALAEVALAFVLIGFPFSRHWQSAVDRLGLRWPSRRALLGAVLFTAGMFGLSLLTGLLAGLLQPGVVARIEERMLPVTTEFGSPAWALALGILAGVGEELLFRGAVQPRYGLLLTALLFTVVHVQYELSIVTLGVFGLAILLGIERRRLGTSACIVTHALYDAIAVLLQNALR
ncbi:hypothetical protein HRbin28_01190 [bacterium HR28]|nr:hypothetical protein HRbin28_01190 [bacterium HR28]